MNHASFFIILLLLSCSKSQSILTGNWGDKANNSSLEVNNESAKFDFTCAAAEITGQLPDDESSFVKSGTYIIQHGIIFEGHDPASDIKQASFTFTVDGDTMTVVIKDSITGYLYGSFTYVKNTLVSVFKCP
jgi:hypothetical protein